MKSCATIRKRGRRNQYAFLSADPFCGLKRLFRVAFLRLRRSDIRFADDIRLRRLIYPCGM